MVIFRWKEDNEWNEKKESFLLASVRCRNDNKEVIVNTYGPRLNKRMKRIQEAGCVSIFAGILKDDNDKGEEYVRIGRVKKNDSRQTKSLGLVCRWKHGWMVTCCYLQWLWGRKVPRLIGAPIVTHRRNCGKSMEV